MVSRRSQRWLARAAGVAVVGTLLLSIAPAQAAPWGPNRIDFANGRFAEQWQAADAQVASGQTARSWTWGPAPWFDYYEFYADLHRSTRMVQYFDKARMELRDQSGRSTPTVTNGLLPVELISGRVKFGDGIGPDQNEQREPSQIPVAGDPANNNPHAPTYASFSAVASADNGYRDPNKVGQRVGTTFRRDGAIGFRQDLADQPGTELVSYETVTGHNVPRVFRDFISSGPIEGIVAFGHPITDPYWITARVQGVERDILVQIFERRVVTYTPSNPQRFKVEMGNVGQHYFLWRYAHLGQPWTFNDPEVPVTFGQIASGTTTTIATDPNGKQQRPLVTGPGSTIPFSLLRSWKDGATRIWGETTRFDGKRQVVSFLPDGTDLRRELTSHNNDYQPSVSPDGTKVAFVSDRDGNPELYMMQIGSQAEPVRLTETQGCENGHPSWMSDGSGVVFESNCPDGTYNIYYGLLGYEQDRWGELRIKRLITPDAGDAIGIVRETGDQRYPRVAPSGNKIAYTSTQDGNPEVYVISSPGGVRRLTRSPGVDQGATWSVGDAQLIFNSNRDGDYELYRMYADGSELVQITNNGVDDAFPLWWQ